ncbi:MULTISPECIES: VanW family protein [Dietzia]|uniref:VanW family protein n=1 Tax=Dietzia TaxID=37914 RepID=UPI0007849070|nr:MULTISPECIES: peptidoglycan binding domain-containing protein [Dietzia]MCT1641412.1 VanW family protein [Dietzia cinnamea]MCT2139610.1 VanW family protein [Dietzia cinnamea]MCT2301759.1 VanW family protein [Dietzia cinnamea]
MDESTSTDGGPARPVAIEGSVPRPTASERRSYRVHSRWLHTGVGVFMALSVLYGFDLVNSIGRVPRGTEVAGIEVGGMTTADAERRLVEELGPRVDDEVDLRAGAVSTTLDPQAVGLSVDWQGTLDRAGEQPLNPITRLISLVWSTDVGIASVIPDARLTDFLERLALQADFEPREGAIWFDRDQVRSAIPLDGQRLQIENSRDAVLEHWLDDDGVDLPVDYTPTETDAEQVRALIRDVAEPAATRDVTLLASRLREDGTEPPVTTITTRLPAPPPPAGRERPESAEREIEMIDPDDPDAVPVVFPRDRIGEYLTFVREGDVLEPRFDADAAKGILEPLLEPTEQEGRDAGFEFSGTTATVVPAVQGRTVEWGPLLGALPGQLTDTAGPRVLPVSYVGRDPELTTEEAERAGIREPVGQFTVAVGANGRAQSMIASLAGHFIPAGESFSMAEIAGTVSGDTSADAVATALFNAALEAGAQDPVRTSRGADGEAFPSGRDATASADVGFRNAQGTGLVIDASGSGNSVTVRLWGTREYTVRISTAPRTDVLRAPTRVVTTAGCTPSPGRDGYTARVTRTVQRGGTTVSTDTVSSTYPPQERVECRAEQPDAGAADPPPPSPSPPGPGPIRIPGLPEIRIPGLPGN